MKLKKRRQSWVIKMITFDPHLPVDWMSDVSLKFMNFAVIKLGLALEIRSCE